MGHEIEKNDRVVLHKTQAWHGLGLVVEDAPTPREALTLAGLDWGVEQKAIFIMSDGKKEFIESHVANYRGDTKEFLGMVSANYQPIQNCEMADFCEALSEEGDVKCETVGSIQNGKRVWFLLKGEKFEVAKADQMFPYILVSNGHDGTTTFRVTPTTVRAVCSNTLHLVIPRIDTGELMSSAISIRHTRNIVERVTEAKIALSTYGKAVDEMKELANTLSAKDVTKEEVQKFFLECYTADFGEVPTNPQNKKEERRRDRATSAFNSFSKRFDDERKISGTSLWNCVNAYSGLIQHDKKARGQNDVDRIEKRVNSNLFGLGQERTQAALQRAFTMAN